MAIDGLIKKRANLIANKEQTIEFATGIQNLSIANMGSGKVAYKIGGTVTGVADDTANFIDESVPMVDIYKGSLFCIISLISDTDTTVQWDTF